MTHSKSYLLMERVQNGHLYKTDDYICAYCGCDIQDTVWDEEDWCDWQVRPATLPNHSYQEFRWTVLNVKGNNPSK